MKRLFRLLKKSPRVWFMALEAFFLSGYYRWQILNRPFEKLSKKIGRFQEETPLETLDESQILLVRDIQYAVTGICSHTPWESKCLVQALTARTLLTRHGLSSTLYMGVGKDEHDQMIAHAWLRCGHIFVTGGNGFLHFAVTGTYA